RQLWNNLRIGDVILSDRGFCSFFSIHSLLPLGVDGVMRLHKSREVDFRRGKRLGKDDFLLQWKKPRQRAAVLSQEEFDALPESLQLRHIRLAVNVKGFRTRNIILVTTLLDPEAYPAEAIAKLYLQRWSVELHYYISVILSCLSPEMIQKELIMHVIAYNLVRALMQHAAICHHVDLDSLSFKG